MIMATIEQQSSSIPDITVSMINRFDGAIRDVRIAPTLGHAKARLPMVYRLGAKLKQQANTLVQQMEKGDAWLDANKEHHKFSEREDQWLGWEAEYRAIEDALERGKAML